MGDDFYKYNINAKGRVTFQNKGSTKKQNLFLKRQQE